MHQLLVGKDEIARVDIAQRVGDRLCVEDLPEVELRAAEALARHLVADAVERVRGALAQAVATASCLPRDVALKIAHDVDAVACPFLQATEVFCEDDWKQLVLTVSRGARVAVATRSSLSEGVAVSLAELGDSIVAQALVENSAAPMTQPVCDTLMDRFEGTGWVLDKLAGRDDLFADTAARLISKVSDSVGRHLTATYGLAAAGKKLSEEAETGALLKLIRKVPARRLPAFVKHLREREKLSFTVMLAALEDGSVEFFSAALSDIAGLPGDKVAHLIAHGSDAVLNGLLDRAQIPPDIYAKIWRELNDLRRSGRMPR